jgi:hypothetical protein
MVIFNHILLRLIVFILLVLLVYFYSTYELEHDVPRDGGYGKSFNIMFYMLYLLVFSCFYLLIESIWLNKRKRTSVRNANLIIALPLLIFLCWFVYSFILGPGFFTGLWSLARER